LSDKKSKTKFTFNNKKRQNKETNVKTAADEFKVAVKVELPLGETIISDRSLRSAERKTENSIRKEIKNGDKKQRQSKKVERKELSQQEMLEEAIITEQINLKSLKEYQKLELEKAKKSKFAKHSIKGPFIRYQSVSMPLIEELSDEINNPSAKTYSRTFISFSDDKSYESFLNSMKPSSTEVPKKSVCPVTQFPARYIDPVSQLPYATSQAFSAIRNQYLKHLEIDGNINQPEVAQWIDWRQQNQQKWIDWQQKYCSYDNKIMLNDNDAQSNHNQFLISKVNSIPQVLQSYRKGRKSKK